MASKITIKKTVKQLRILLHSLDKSKKTTPVVKNLLASLSKTQSIKFNVPVEFIARGVPFNKVIPVRFNLTVEKISFKSPGFNLTRPWTNK